MDRNAILQDPAYDDMLRPWFVPQVAPSLSESELAQLHGVLRAYAFDWPRRMLDLAEELMTQGDRLGLYNCLSGIALMKLGRFGEAVDRFLTARALAPEQAGHAYNLGLVALHAGERAAAVDLFRSALSFAPLALAFAQLARLAAEEGDWPAAEAAAREALAGEMRLGGLVELVLAEATRRQGRAADFASLASAGEAPAADPARFGGAAGPTVFMSLTPDELDAAETTVRSLAAAGCAWPVWLEVCNPAPATVAALAALAGASSAPVRWTVRRVAVGGGVALRRRARLGRYRSLRDLMAATGAVVLDVAPGTIFAYSPAAWAPGEGTQGAWLAERTTPAPLWDEVSAGLLLLAPGETSERLLAAMAASEAALSPDITTPFLEEALLWRARQSAGLVGKLALAADGTVSDGLSRPLLRLPPRRADAPGADLTPRGERPQINELLPSRHGQLLLNRNDIYVTESVRETGVWSADELDLLAQLISPGDTVLDVGGNMGTHTVAFCEFVGPTGRVIAFEPQRIMFQTMVANIALNSFTNAWCHLAGVGAQPGRLRLPPVNYASSGNFGLMSLRPDWEGSQALKVTEGTWDEVDIVTIDSLGLERCDLIKMDIEGMEADALKGAAETLRRLKPVIFMECQRDANGEAALQVLKDFGYRVWFQLDRGARNAVGLPPGSEIEIFGLAEA